MIQEKKVIPKVIRCSVCNKKTDYIYKGNSLCKKHLEEAERDSS